MKNLPIIPEEYLPKYKIVANIKPSKDELEEKMPAQKTKCAQMIAGLVDTSRVLSCFKHDPKEQYRMFVEGKISHAEQKMLIQKDMKAQSSVHL